MDLTQGRSAISFAWKETGFTNMKAGQHVEQAFPELETALPRLKAGSPSLSHTAGEETFPPAQVQNLR